MASVPPKLTRYYTKRVKVTDANMGDFKWVVIDRKTGQPTEHHHEKFYVPGGKDTVESVAKNSAKWSNTRHEGLLKDEEERKTRNTVGAKWLDDATERDIVEVFADSPHCMRTLLDAALAVADQQAREANNPQDMNRFAEWASKIKRLINAL